MKKNTHPKYQEVLFVDTSNGYKFVCGSTLQPKDTEEFEGKTYPVYKVSISSASHPFFTGSKQFIDTEGRLDKFSKKYAKKKEEVLKAKEVEEENALKKTKKRAKSK
ncbi:MAG: 50S ribosomal protein L31 [Chlamydiae bacterium RIFCSPHIGHO2_12_FULL_27_8]|nr:MAG: 50S ribosomal protein L31 [Chlamydiae bacterium RIFCSPHIGHO2_12_FULL_27_8]